MLTVGERIRAVRESLGMTAGRFAKSLAVSRQYIPMLEDGRNEPSNQLIRLICREFDIDEEWLQTGAGTMRPLKSVVREAAARYGGEEAETKVLVRFAESAHYQELLQMIAENTAKSVGAKPPEIERLKAVLVKIAKVYLSSNTEARMAIELLVSKL